MPTCIETIMKATGRFLLSVVISLSCAWSAVAAGIVAPDDPGSARQEKPALHQTDPPAGSRNERQVSPATGPTDKRPDKSVDVDTERLRDLERELAGDPPKAGSYRGGE